MPHSHESLLGRQPRQLQPPILVFVVDRNDSFLIDCFVNLGNQNYVCGYSSAEIELQFTLSIEGNGDTQIGSSRVLIEWCRMGEWLL